MEVLAEMLNGEMSNFKDKILRTICNWLVKRRRVGDGGRGRVKGEGRVEKGG